MNIDPNTPLDLIQTPPELQRFIKDLDKHARIAVDTESNSLFAYQERVCLIQFSYDSRDVLVDPIQLDDLSSLGAVFSNPSIEKIFHGSEYDLMCLKRDFDFEFVNISDTRVSCRTLGWSQSGLGALLEQIFDVKVNKKYQRANWGARPLSDDMKFYARLDTHYLIPLQEHLEVELREKGLYEEAAELCALLTQVRPHANGFDPDGFWGISHIRDFKPDQLSVLRELYNMRDQEARRRDRPPFKIMHDKTLLAIAKALPKDPAGLECVPDMPAAKVRHYKWHILDAVRKGLQSDPPDRPSRKKRDEEFHHHYEHLHRWRKLKGRARKVESDIILPREILSDIAKAAPRTLEQLLPIMGPLQWRFEAYGEEILKALWG